MASKVAKKTFSLLASNKLVRGIFSILHYEHFYNDFDALRVLTETEAAHYQLPPMKYRMNVRYLPPLLLYLLYFLNVLSILAQYGFSLDAIPGNCLPGQKLLPGDLVEQANIFFNTVVLMATVPPACLLFHRMEPFERHFRMWAIVGGDGQLKMVLQNGHVLDREVGEQMLKLHRRAKRLTAAFIFSAYIESVPFYYYNEASNWSASLQDYFMLLWITVSLPYLVIHIYTPVFCFILYGRYLRIKQRRQMYFLGRLLEQLATISGSGHSHQYTGNTAGPVILSAVVRQFMAISHRLSQLSRELLGYNAFWSRYLSSYYCCITFIVTSLAFFYTVGEKDQKWIITSFEVFFFIMLMCMLMWITAECSLILYNNKRLAKMQRAFTFRARMVWPRMHLKMLLQFDHIEAGLRKLAKIGFTVFESVQINSKTFELLFAYISVIFMQLVEKKI